MAILELHLDEWEPLVIDKGFAIRDRKTKQYLGQGKTLKGATLNAREKSIKNLRGH